MSMVVVVVVLSSEEPWFRSHDGIHDGFRISVCVCELIIAAFV